MAFCYPAPLPVFLSLKGWPICTGQVAYFAPERWPTLRRNSGRFTPEYAQGGISTLWFSRVALIIMSFLALSNEWCDRSNVKCFLLLMVTLSITCLLYTSDAADDLT